MSVAIKIIYHDEYRNKTGRQHDVINLDQNIQVAHKSIKEHLKQYYSITPPYLLKIRGMSIKSAVKEGLELYEGETVDLLPIPALELIRKISQYGYIRRF